MTPVTRPLVAALLGLLVWAPAAWAQVSFSVTPNPFGSGATLTVSAQSDTPPEPGTDICGQHCIVLSSYTYVYVEGSNGCAGFKDAYDQRRRSTRGTTRSRDRR